MKGSIIIALVAAASCASAPPAPSSAIPVVPAGITFEGGDGHDCPSRVLVKGANYETGVDAEYAWLQAKYPGFKRQHQTLVDCDGKKSDKLEILTADGYPLTIYFDVTDFFGKGLL